MALACHSRKINGYLAELRQCWPGINLESSATSCSAHGARLIMSLVRADASVAGLSRGVTMRARNRVVRKDVGIGAFILLEG